MTYGTLISEDPDISNGGTGVIRHYAIPHHRIVRITVWFPPQEGIYSKNAPTARVEILTSSNSVSTLMSNPAIVVDHMTENPDVEPGTIADKLYERACVMLTHLDGHHSAVDADRVTPVYATLTSPTVRRGTLLAVYTDETKAAQAVSAVNASTGFIGLISIGFTVEIDPDAQALSDIVGAPTNANGSETE